MDGKFIYRDPEWLRARYIDDRMTMEEVAKAAGCLPETVFYWLRKLEIPTRSKGEAQRKRLSRECEHCGKAMEVKVCLAKKGIGRFCSKDCWYAHAKELTTAEEAAHIKARELLNTAVSTGRIRKPSECSSCGAPGYIEGHHPDHSKPLEVEWLCLKCHGKQHRKRQ